MPMTEENVVVEETVENTTDVESTEVSEEVTPEFTPFEYSFDKETRTVNSQDELKELVELGEYYRTKGKAGDEWLKSYAKDNDMSKSELLEAFKQQKEETKIQTIADNESVSFDVAKKLRTAEILTEKSLTDAQKASEKKRQDEQMSLFNDKYPDVKELPQQVWDRFAKGDVDLTEAYDLFNKDNTIQELQEKLSKYENIEAIANKNTSNAEASTGSTSGNGTAEASKLTAEAINKMSPKELMARWSEVKKVTGMK